MNKGYSDKKPKMFAIIHLISLDLTLHIYDNTINSSEINIELHQPFNEIVWSASIPYRSGNFSETYEPDIDAGILFILKTLFNHIYEYEIVESPRRNTKAKHKEKIMSNEITVYIPSLGLFLMASEGSGDNLTQEDIDNGSVDYTYIEVYEYKDRDLVESDGGLLLLDKPFKEKYPDIKDCINDVMTFMFNEVHDYVVIESK